MNESNPTDCPVEPETAKVSLAELVLLESILPDIIQAMMQATDENEKDENE